MRILLIKPKARLRAVLGLQAFQLLEPLELGYLASAVSPQHVVRIIDLRLTRFENVTLARVLKRFEPDVVGITGYTHESSVVKKMASWIRSRKPKVRIIVGGHHATVAPEDYEIDPIDAIVRGEGCAPFREIIERTEKGAPLTAIPNVIVPGYGIRNVDDWPQFPDPATLPQPRRELWVSQRYRSIWTGEVLPPRHPLFVPVTMVRSSWGCKMHCTFCIVPFLCGGQHQTRPVDSVVHEIEMAPTDHIYFSDDENFIDEDFAWQLAEALEKRGIHKRYFAWARSTTVNRSPELLKKWRSIGLDSAFLGFEFPTNEELKRTKKGATVRGNERALTTLRSMGVAVHAAFMVRPEYTEEEFQRLRIYVDSMPPVQCSFTVCTPSPGTPDYQAIRKDIWVDNPHDLHDCMHPLTPTTLPLRRFAQLFAEQASAGTAKTPMRVNRHRAPVADLLRVFIAERRYYYGFRDMYRDYPRDLWDRS